MNDLISRKEVLQALEDVFKEYRMSWGREYGGFGAAVQESIENLPSDFTRDRIIAELKETQKNVDIKKKVALYARDEIGFYLNSGISDGISEAIIAIEEREGYKRGMTARGAMEIGKEISKGIQDGVAIAYGDTNNGEEG